MMTRILDTEVSQRGAALPMVLLTILFLTLLGFMAMTTASVEVRLSANERDYQQAIYTAEAGLEHTRAVLKSLLNICNQTNIASGGNVDWDFALQNPLVCAPVAGQSGPLSIQADFGKYQYTVEIANNSDDPSGDAQDDDDQKIVVTSIGIGPNGVRAGVEIVLDAENSSSDVSGYSGQLGAGSGKNFVGRDAEAISDTTTQNLGNL
jgi:hypothetical protein